MSNVTIPQLPVAGAITGAELVVLSQSGVMSSALLSAIAAYLSSLTAVGSLIDFAGAAAPTGYLACPLVANAGNGVSRITYAALFAVIGTTWGAGDGSTTFNLPWFPADYAAVQANANVGTNSVGVVLAHTHTVWGTYALSQPRDGAVGQPSARESINTTLSQSPAGGSANLAAGVRVLKCVKY
jgi:microcystin-dependent protein